MPIYGDKLTGTQYKVVTQIEIKDYKKLMDKFIKALNSFSYRDNRLFARSIEMGENYGKIQYVNTKYEPAVYNKDWIKTLEGKFPFIAQYKNSPTIAISDYKYGIMMEALIKEANIIIGDDSKYMLDITGSWVDGKVIILKKK